MVESMVMRSAVKEKSNTGFYWGLAASFSVFAVQMVANTNAGLHTDAMAANALQGLDGSAYGIVAVAANHEKREGLLRAQRLRKIAAAAICFASLCIGCKAGYDLAFGKFDRPSPAAAVIVAGAGVANILISRRLGHDAELGTAHRDGWRHAVGDATSNLVSAGAILAASQGFVGLDLAAAAATSAATVGVNWPTHRRIHGNA